MTALNAGAAQDLPRRRGRRPATEDTRGVILAAARAEFAARGYDQTTLRAVARVAGVDARLVHHYFESKDDLFVAALALPVRPQDLVDQVLAGPPEGIGERLVRFFFGVWDSPHGREVITGMVRSAVSHEDAADMLRQFLTAAVLGRIAGGLNVPDPQLRAALAASQMIGVVFLRYIIKVEPLASASVEELTPFLAPVLQRHLTGPAPGEPPARVLRETPGCD